MFPVIELPPGGVSLQWVYNRVRDHLLKQGVRSKESGSCLYRGPNETACAAGCLIRDDLYSPELEYKSIGWNEAPWNAVAASLNLKVGDNITEENLQMFKYRIQELQGIHDNVSFEPFQWADKLREFAEKNQLVP